jgi:hypothetical protein
MKSRALMLCAALAALPAFGEEPAAQAQPVQDSPLVAAAKRSKLHAHVPGTVITNETVRRHAASAHVTTTRRQRPLAKVGGPAATARRGASDKASAITDGGVIGGVIGGTAAGAVRAKPDPEPRKAPRFYDAEKSELEDRGDTVFCRACLPILEPVSASLPMRKAEPSANPPRPVPARTVDDVPARTVDSVPVRSTETVAPQEPRPQPQPPEPIKP